MRTGVPHSAAMGVNSRVERPDSPTGSRLSAGRSPPATATVSRSRIRGRAPSASMHRRADRVSSQNSMFRSTDSPSHSSEAASARWA